MRLTDDEIIAIKTSFATAFGEGDVHVFGSRVDNDARGGDIDLYLCPKVVDNEFKQKIDFLVELKGMIGEQKIDVVVARDSERLIEREARRTGIRL